MACRSPAAANVTRSSSAAGLGVTVGPLLGGWLYETWGPQAPFYANGIALALSTLVLWALLQVPEPVG